MIFLKLLAMFLILKLIEFNNDKDMKELIEFLEKRGLKKEAESLKAGATNLNLYLNNIGIEVAELVAKVLEFNSITTLDLYGSNIKAKGVKYLAEVLKSNKSLKVLYLGWNNIGNNGVKYLAETLKFNKSLKVLNLGWNNIDNNGAPFIAKILEFNDSITDLYLERNNILEAGAKLIVEALEFNHSITNFKFKLYVYGNKIGDKESHLIDYCLQRNKTIAEKKTDDISVLGDDSIFE